MKEITQIHIASFPYHIALDAKQELEHYLAAIQQSLVADDEAMREIEARIVELLVERKVTSKKVITASDVAAIKNQLGDPKEFADEGAVQQLNGTIPEKRLMRDMRGALLGGVSTGLAAYFTIDVVLVRVLWAVCTFATFGVAVLVYIAMWIIVPKAVTAADRLVMAGKSVTLESLKDTSGDSESITEPPLAFVLRMMLVVSLALGSVASLAVLGFMMYSVRVSYFSIADLSPHAGGALVAFSVVSVLLSLLFALLAYITFTRKTVRRYVKSITSIVASGLVLAGVGFGLILYDSRQSVILDNTANVVESVPAPSELKSTRNVVVSAGTATEVSYVVASGSYRARLSYDKRAVSGPNKVTLEAKDGTLYITTEDASKDCSQTFSPVCYQVPSILTVYGPSLDQIILEHGVMSYSPLLAQSQLSVIGEQTAVLTIRADKVIDKLNATLNNGAVLDAQEANIRAVGAQFG